MNQAAFGPGVLGDALYLNAATEIVLQPTQSIHYVAMWLFAMKAQNAPILLSESIQPVFGIQETPGGFAFMVHDTSGENALFFLSVSGNGPVMVPVTNTWTHLVVIFPQDTLQNPILYINGTFAGAATAGMNYLPAVRIGDGTTLFADAIDELVVFSPLYSNEITSLYAYIASCNVPQPRHCTPYDIAASDIVFACSFATDTCATLTEGGFLLSPVMLGGGNFVYSADSFVGRYISFSANGGPDATILIEGTFATPLDCTIMMWARNIHVNGSIPFLFDEGISSQHQDPFGLLRDGVDLTEWHHIAMRRNDSVTVDCFFDGELISTITMSAALTHFRGISSQFAQSVDELIVINSRYSAWTIWAIAHVRDCLSLTPDGTYLNFELFANAKHIPFSPDRFTYPSTGFYAPFPAQMAPEGCPRSTYSPDAYLRTFNDCVPCPEGTFGGRIGGSNEAEACRVNCTSSPSVSTYGEQLTYAVVCTFDTNVCSVDTDQTVGFSPWLRRDGVVGRSAFIGHKNVITVNEGVTITTPSRDTVVSVWVKGLNVRSNNAVLLAAGDVPSVWMQNGVVFVRSPYDESPRTLNYSLQGLSQDSWHNLAFFFDGREGTIPMVSPNIVTRLDVRLFVNGTRVANITMQSPDVFSPQYGYSVSFSSLGGIAGQGESTHFAQYMDEFYVLQTPFAGNLYASTDPRVITEDTPVQYQCTRATYPVHAFFVRLDRPDHCRATFHAVMEEGAAEIQLTYLIHPHANVRFVQSGAQVTTTDDGFVSIRMDSATDTLDLDVTGAITVWTVWKLLHYSSAERLYPSADLFHGVAYMTPKDVRDATATIIPQECVQTDHERNVITGYMVGVLCVVAIFAFAVILAWKYSNVPKSVMTTAKYSRLPTAHM
jgi:hypothetical protein